MTRVARAVPFLVLAACAAWAARAFRVRRMERDIDRLGRRLREHLGLEGGDT